MHITSRMPIFFLFLFANIIINCYMLACVVSMLNRCGVKVRDCVAIQLVS